MWDDDLRPQMLGYLPFLTMFLVCILWDLKIYVVIGFSGQGSFHTPSELALRNGDYASTDPEKSDGQGELFSFNNFWSFKPK